MKHFPFACLLLSITVAGCGIQQREEQLKKKEAELNRKEQQLLLKERSLNLKEAELLQKEQHLDSSRIDSTAHFYNDTLIGNWNVQMVCTETTCPSSAVGDTKAEQWTIDYQASQVIAKAFANKKLTRIYTGAYNGSTLELTEEPDSTSQSTTRMVVRLHLTPDQMLEGQREIIRTNDCRVVYDLQAKKQL